VEVGPFGATKRRPRGKLVAAAVVAVVAAVEAPLIATETAWEWKKALTAPRKSVMMSPPPDSYEER